MKHQVYSILKSIQDFSCPESNCWASSEKVDGKSDPIREMIRHRDIQNPLVMKDYDFIAISSKSLDSAVYAAFIYHYIGHQDNDVPQIVLFDASDRYNDRSNLLTVCRRLKVCSAHLRYGYFGFNHKIFNGQKVLFVIPPRLSGWADQTALQLVLSEAGGEYAKYIFHEKIGHLCKGLELPLYEVIQDFENNLLLDPTDNPLKSEYKRRIAEIKHHYPVPKCEMAYPFYEYREKKAGRLVSRHRLFISRFLK